MATIKKQQTDIPPESNDIIQTVQKTIRKKSGPDPLKFGCDNVEPGDNARYLRLALTSWDMPPIDISDPLQVRNRISQYFQHCVDNDRKPNMVGMANWLGVSRDTLNSWKRGEYRTETHSDIIKKALAIIEEQWVDYMLNGKVNPASGIFIGKNHLQYSDTQQVILTPNNPLDNLDDSTAKQKVLDALPPADE